MTDDDKATNSDPVDEPSMDDTESASTEEPVEQDSTAEETPAPDDSESGVPSPPLASPADVDDVDDVNAASTTITLNTSSTVTAEGLNVASAANFKRTLQLLIRDFNPNDSHRSPEFGNVPREDGAFLLPYQGIELG